MANRFGFSTEPTGGDFLPILKYDARAGRLFRVDRIDVGGQFSSEPVDITSTFKAILDLEHVDTGWISFNTGGAPDFKLVPMGSELPARPSDGHKNGIRFMLKLDKASAGGQPPIREIAGTAKAFLSGVEKVFEQYEAERAKNPGKLPVVVMEGSTPIKSGTGDKTSTNYVPKFKIVGWAPRGDLVYQPKGAAAVAYPPLPATPPATGSTRVEPPPARQPESVDLGDFG